VDLDETGLGALLVFAAVTGGNITMARARIVLVVVRRRPHDPWPRPRRPGRNRPNVAWHHAALANHLVERDPRRHGHVQGSDVTEERQGDEVVAVLADQSAKPLALSAEHQGDGSSTIDLIPPFGSRGVEADDPYPARLHGFERLHEVATPRHAHVLEPAGRSAGHGLREAGRVPFRKDDAVGPRTFGRPQDRTEVSGILDAVEDHDERGSSRRFEELFETDQGFLGHDGYEALVRDASGHAVEGLSRLEPQRDTELARPADRIGYAPIAQALDHEQTVEMTGSRGERLEHGIDATDEVHGVFVK
jgi:hypothetical protein